MITEDDGNFLVGFGKWVRNAALGKNDDGAVHRGPQPGYMSMPEKSTSLANNGEVVHIALVSLYGTLSYIGWSISPPCLKLSNAMPVPLK